MYTFSVDMENISGFTDVPTNMVLLVNQNTYFFFVL